MMTGEPVRSPPPRLGLDSDPVEESGMFPLVSTVEETQG